MLLKRITNKLNSYLRKAFNRKNKQRLQNHSPTIIASNCTGGFIAHDLGLRFNSPFINLYLKPKDFIRYLANMSFYQQQSLTFIETDKNYPVAKLADIEIHFMHYHSPQDAMEKWQQRTARINPDNLFIIMTERDGCDYQDLIDFDKLPFQHKVVFTHKDYPEIQSAFKIKDCISENKVGDLFEYSGLTGKRYYDQFDYVSWFNQKI